jgi:hypothetical protein
MFHPDAQVTTMRFADRYVSHVIHIEAPEKLTVDPMQGRFTLNGFFTSRRNVV